MLENDTRWNSTYKMTIQASRLSKQIDSFMESNVPEGISINAAKGVFIIKRMEEEDWMELNYIKEFLYKFNVYTKGFESDLFITFR